MITRLRKAQDSWIAKGILILTALSFMSLFGISGYISSAARNSAVVKVNNQLISQYEMDVKLNQEISRAMQVFGDFEVSDDIREAMLKSLVQSNLDEMILNETAMKNKVSISDRVIRGIIFAQPQFIDKNGNFSRSQFEYFLSQSHMSEKEYVDLIRRDLMNGFLIKNPTSGFNIPSILRKYASDIASQRKVFKYISVEENDDLIKEDISQEDIEQYYEDFAPEFIEPENRDVKFLSLSVADINKKIEISEEEIKDYYQQNIHLFSVPETRHVLQMVFDNQKAADEAKKALDKGDDFYKVAQEKAQQSKKETDLDFIAEDMLLEDIAADVFTTAKGKIVGPIESELGWHIMKVVDIKAGSVDDLEKSRQKIRDTLVDEKFYEFSYDIINQIEDKIGGGASLQDIAQDMNTSIYDIKGLREDGTASVLPTKHAEILQNNDFIDTVFSRIEEDIPCFVETDDGYVFLKVEKITDSHPQTIEVALPKIKKLWRESEKAAIAQEIINSIVEDIENGKKIEDVAKKYKYKVTTTAALSRDESFANLTQVQVARLFNKALNEPEIISDKGLYQIVVADKDAEPKKLNEEEKEVISQRLQLALSQAFEKALIESYGKDYDIRVKYRLLGIDK